MQYHSVATLHEILAKESENPQFAFLDVRSPEEYQEAHIQGVRNIPLHELPSRLQELSGAQAIYLHCRSGGRSLQAARYLEQQGITAEIINVEGGILSWIQAGYPVVTQRDARSL